MCLPQWLYHVIFPSVACKGSTSLTFKDLRCPIPNVGFFLVDPEKNTTNWRETESEFTI